MGLVGTHFCHPRPSSPLPSNGLRVAPGCPTLSCAIFPGWGQTLHIPGAKELVLSWDKQSKWRWGKCYILASTSYGGTTAQITVVDNKKLRAMLKKGKEWSFQADTLQVPLPSMV